MRTRHLAPVATLALLLAASTAAGQERIASTVWFDEIDPQSRTDTLSYRKGAVAINVVLTPSAHTATGSVAVYGTWMDCAVTSAFLVDQARHRESLTGSCPPGGPSIGVFQSQAGSTTLGQLLAHATSLQFVQANRSVAIELTGLGGAFSRAASYQQASGAGGAAVPGTAP